MNNIIEKLKSKNPLVHCITNYVTVNDVANILLASGASPIMADDIAEVAEITSISNALLINIGTLNARTVESMILAGKTANSKNIPVVLDPVGAGASTLRNQTVKRLIEEVNFRLIKGNMSEVSYLAGLKVSTRGVDSCESDNKNDSTAVAKSAAKMYGCIVVITGAVDTISDGDKVVKVANGVARMSKITGTGCMLGAVLGAYIASSDDGMAAATAAVAAMGICGEIAAEKTQELGTGSFRVALIDAMSMIDDNLVKSRAKVNEA